MNGQKQQKCQKGLIYLQNSIFWLKSYWTKG